MEFPLVPLPLSVLGWRWYEDGPDRSGDAVVEEYVNIVSHLAKGMPYTPKPRYEGRLVAVADMMDSIIMKGLKNYLVVYRVNDNHYPTLVGNQRFTALVVLHIKGEVLRQDPKWALHIPCRVARGHEKEYEEEVLNAYPYEEVSWQSVS